MVEHNELIEVLSLVGPDPTWDPEDSDWWAAFSVATVYDGDGIGMNVVLGKIDANDVAHMLLYSNGMNDEEHWVGVGQLRGGRYFYVDSWCDDTGWDCQSDGEVFVTESLEKLVRLCVPKHKNDRLFQAAMLRATQGASPEFAVWLDERAERVGEDPRGEYVPS